MLNTFKNLRARIKPFITAAFTFPVISAYSKSLSSSPWWTSPDLLSGVCSFVPLLQQQIGETLSEPFLYQSVNQPETCVWKSVCLLFKHTDLSMLRGSVSTDPPHFSWSCSHVYTILLPLTSPPPPSSPLSLSPPPPQDHSPELSHTHIKAQDSRGCVRAPCSGMSVC